MEKRPDLDSDGKEVKTGGFRVENMFLIESSFTREKDIDLRNVEINNEIGINTIPHEVNANNKFGVILSLDFKGKQNDKVVCNGHIKMMGLFEKVGEPAISDDAFKKINAPAIIYPFVREHLHNICLKAGIANVLLPTVNFKL